jgi:hypothetical protein
MGWQPIVGIAYIQTAFLLQAIFTIWPDIVPIQIQTGDWRSSRKKQGAARIISFKTSQYFAFWPV